MRFLSRFFLFPGCPDALPAPGPLFPGATAVDYTTADGIVLRGAWVRCGKPDALTVVYFHGNAESAASNLPVGTRLAAAGVDTFLAEYRGYGGRPGTPSEEGLFLDAAAALEHVLASGVVAGRVVLAGRSLGTGVAVELARRGHGRALFLVSPYTSIPDVARSLVGPLGPVFMLDRFDSLARIPDVRVPVVAFHGTEDALIPFALGERLVAAAPSGRMVPIPERGHNDLDPGELLAREVESLVRGQRLS